jgi:uncharacterized protein (TIGR03066 family)
MGGGGGRPAGGGGNFGGGGGGARPNPGGGGGASNHSPSFSHPTGGGSSRPGNAGGGNRPNTGGNVAGGNRPNSGGNATGGNRPNTGGNTAGGNRPSIGGQNTGAGNRANAGNSTNVGNRTNIGQIGNKNVNNINSASNRPYYNNWQHGNWNGNWNHPGGSGYWNGWAHGYAQGYNHGYWNGGWGGYWHGGAGGYWGGAWYTAPIAWGLGAWALGSIMYSSGYGMYSNPYYGGGASSAYYDYSQPITVINQQADPSASVAATDPAAGTDTGSAPVPPEVQEGTSHMDLARDAFKSGDYDGAGREIDLAIKALPRDAALHEFRALVFFATKDYKQAAGTLYAVLSAGPGWDWTTLGGMYDSTATYSEQLRNLEQYVKDNPRSADARFVLAYHYLTCGHSDSAKRQYQEVLKLQPKDQLSAQLLKLLGDEPSTAAGEKPAPQPPDAGTSSEESPAPPADIDAAKLVGKWTAKRPDGTTFSLNLTSDAKFTWGFSQGTKKQEFGGKYSVDGAVLVLERADGAQMPGIVSLADGGFNFKLYGGQPDDPGLDFKK